MGQRNHQIETRQAQVHQRFIEANQVRDMVVQLKALLAQAWARQHQRGGFSCVPNDEPAPSDLLNHIPLKVN